MSEEEQLRIGWGGKVIEARGSLVVALLMALSVAGFLEYQAANRGVAAQQQHNRIADNVELQTCILSIPPDDRVKLRQELIKSSNPRETLRIGWCPWLERLNNK